MALFWSFKSDNLKSSSVFITVSSQLLLPSVLQFELRVIGSIILSSMRFEPDEVSD